MRKFIYIIREGIGASIIVATYQNVAVVWVTAYVIPKYIKNVMTQMHGGLGYNINISHKKIIYQAEEIPI